jgi:YesN/AraC family two-component response regulator
MKQLLSDINIDISVTPEGNIFIGDDLSITVHDANTTSFKTPVKFDRAAIVLCTEGSKRVKINLHEYELESSMLITLMPGQIIEVYECTPDYKAYAISLSRRFIDMVNIPGWQQNYISMYNNPTMLLNDSQLQAFNTFFSILYRAAEDSDNPFCLQVIENLIRVFYFGGISRFRAMVPANNNVKNGLIERFMELVYENYRTERLIGFYADKLCITPKYLSKLVKEHTGRSASDWIESHVILEARAMLQSSDMTIQQIATSLNFSNQSFFGKYFKRATGISPKQYRSKK